MAKLVQNRSKELLKLVEARALSKREKADEKKKPEILVPDLPKDCISNILLRLPIESLPRSRFVSKPWYNIINDPVFIYDHLCRSETVLIFLSSNQNERPSTFSVETNLIRSKSIFTPLVFKRCYKLYIHFMEIKDGKSEIRELDVCCLGHIKASCNGLVLLENKQKKGGLIVMNPVTRKMEALPLGTIFPPQDESYGFAFSSATKEYKVVHLFRDSMGYVGCEIINLGTRSWRVVDGPCYGLFAWFGYDPVFAIEALHWMPHIDGGEYIVSMDIRKEKFFRTSLPTSSGRFDGIVEMGGFLCFVNHVDKIQMDLWVLKNLCGEDWIKQHSIVVGYMMDMVPLASSRNGEVMFFRREENNSFYTYDIEFEQMTELEMQMGFSPAYGCSYIPHVNSLVSWKSSRDQNHEDM